MINKSYIIDGFPFTMQTEIQGVQCTRIEMKTLTDIVFEDEIVKVQTCIHSDSTYRNLSPVMFKCEHEVFLETYIFDIKSNTPLLGVFIHTIDIDTNTAFGIAISNTILGCKFEITLGDNSIHLNNHWFPFSELKNN